ncbi:Ethanolamine kinase 1 like protein [Argiope bruennichi]|uniref:ethanolamine kinase n=1 Tax=Argiope bruennichi TaxID=94029 RepID=A0A8T0FWV0_ARGBR|nr:Ethanolamine kinase 1 like protein [Argiope bruennichi]
MFDKSNCTLKKLDIVVSPNSFSDVCAGATSIITRIKDWKPDDIGFELLTGGFTNHLVKCYLKNNPDEAVLIRIYGENTELIIDRDLEVRNLQIMCEAGFCAPLHCLFTNGLCYDFTPGEVLDIKMVRDPDISKLIATKLARMHSIHRNVDGIDSQDSIFPFLYKLFHQIPESFPDPVKDLRYKSLIGPKDKLKEEIDCLKAHLLKTESPIVFCHNDLLLRNIIYNNEKKEVTFIDFEYAGYNYQAFDIGNHFCEFSGVANFDPNLYPSKDFQINWLKIYLEAWYIENKLNPKDITEEEIEKFYIIVNKFALAAHLYWGIWALIQSAYSKLELDYLKYAKLKLDQYFSRKEEFLSLEFKS